MLFEDVKGSEHFEDLGGDEKLLLKCSLRSFDCSLFKDADRI